MDSIPAGNPLASEEAFYAEVYRRLVRNMAVLAGVGTGAAWTLYHAPMGLSFFAGGLIAMLNFHWLKRTIEAMGGRLPARKRAAWGVVLRFLLRYVLIALAAYVIFRSTTNSLYGFFAGLSLPAVAIVIEALYQTYRALRTGL
ncbi:MAG TPA: ATP synthase subunit I [Candidatus Acidoferrales bacterium]|nr:ATP synthase subunit I [Candidatus Acidoferrales bacterium]